MPQGNAAYDLFYYRKREQREQTTADGGETPVAAHRSSKTVRLRRINKTASLPKTGRGLRSFSVPELKLLAAAGLSVGLLFTFMALNLNYDARANELANTIAKREQELKTLQNDYEGLKVKYDTRMNDTAIQEYAEKELGMQKRENFQIHWIDVGENNEFENDGLQKQSLIERIAAYFA